MGKDDLVQAQGLLKNLIWKDERKEKFLKVFQDESKDASIKIFNEELDEKVFDESREILARISKILGLGKIILKEENNDLYPPSFYIKADTSLNARERMNLQDRVMDLFYDALLKEGKVEYLTKFFIKIDFSE